VYIHNLAQKFKLIANEFSDSTAVISKNASITYGILDRQSDMLAAHFLSYGIQPGDVICISGQKCISTIICILGALKAGATYSVFDPESPIERLSKIFRQCEPKLVLCSGNLVPGIKAIGFNAVDSTMVTTDSDIRTRDPSVTAHWQQITANSPAYIMFTSGSTGFPKGAIMSHQNVLNLIAWSQQTFEITAADVLTNVNPLFFDNSVFDLYSALFSGASLVLFDSETIRNPAKLMQLINEYKCTSWFSVPSMLIFLQAMHAFSPENMSHIKRIIFGGEGYPKAKLKELFDIYSSRAVLYNVYGPTECTCICSSYKVSEDDFADLNGLLPLGQLAPNFDFLIVDEELQPVKPGQVGELILRGPNIGMGYFDDSDRTTLAFIQNPAHNEFREFVYRTGDLVYIKPTDGKLYIVGRRDNQIKHMGYRIELEEIENAFHGIDSASRCVVVHCEIEGLSQIVAFVESTNGSLGEDSLKKRLQEIIPNYMLPTRFQFVDYLPKNANGKLDRMKLKTDYLGQQMNNLAASSGVSQEEILLTPQAAGNLPPKGLNG